MRSHFVVCECWWLAVIRVPSNARFLLGLVSGRLSHLVFSLEPAVTSLLKEVKVLNMDCESYFLKLVRSLFQFSFN